MSFEIFIILFSWHFIIKLASKYEKNYTLARIWKIPERWDLAGDVKFIWQAEILVWYLLSTFALLRKALVVVSSLLTPTQRHDPLKQKYIKNKLSQCRAGCVIWRSTRHSGGRALDKKWSWEKETRLSHHAAAATAALLSSMNFCHSPPQEAVSGMLLMLEVHHHNIFPCASLMRHRTADTQNIYLPSIAPS